MVPMKILSPSMRLSTIFALVLVGFCFAISASAASVTVNCSGTSASPTSVDEASLSGDDVTFSDAGGDGYCELDAAISASSVIFETGTVTTHPASNIIGVSVTTTGALTIQSGASIDVDDKGCQGGTQNQDGYGPDIADGDTDLDVLECRQASGGYGYDGRGGAAYSGLGGRGHTTDNPQNSAYGSGIEPVHLGSGGGGGSNGGETGGNGGGLISLDVGGTMTLSGTITANGETPSVNSGGGSGGSVFIEATTITGSGSINADGGDGGSNSGGGGGGRIAIHSDDLSGLTIANLVANKGLLGSGASSTDGGEGSTITLDRKTDDGIGTMTIPHGFDFQPSLDYSRTAITALDGAVLRCDSGLSALTIGATGTIAFQGVTFGCSTLDITIEANSWTFTNTNTLNFDEADGIEVTADIDTDLTFTNVTYNGASAGTTSGDGGKFSIENAIDVSLVNSDINSSIDWDGVVDVTIDSNSSINANGLGCDAGERNENGYGPDLLDGDGDSELFECRQAAGGYGKNGRGGAAHAGTGGRGHGAGTDQTTTYGTNTAPTYFGSGGGGGPNSGEEGGEGGGIIYINSSGEITINGPISADGINSPGSAGGGSGGSVYLISTSLAGSSTVSADAGDGKTFGGGGGGGRVALHYGYLSGFNTGDATAALGAQGGGGASEDGTVGTVYLNDLGPSIETSTTGDTDGDGQIDVVYVILSEDLDTGTVATGDFTVSGYTISGASASNTVTAVGGYTGSQVDLTLTESGSADTSTTPEVNIVGSIDDASSNSTTSGSSTPTDSASPAIITIVPSDEATDIVATDDVVLTFSEAIDTGTLAHSFSSEPADIASAWTVGNTVLTFSTSLGFESGTTITLSVTAADDTTGNSLQSSPSAVGGDNSFEFTIATSGGSSHSPSPSPTYDTTLTAPIAGEEYDSSAHVNIEWSYTGSATSAFLDLYYTADGGETYTLIEEMIDIDDNSYKWNASGIGGEISLRLDVNDLSDSLLIVDGDAFTLSGDVRVIEEGDLTPNPTETTNQATSPVTGELEDVTVVEIGSFVRSESFDTVYYIADDYTRRPFYNSQTFFTWQDSFDSIVFTTDATLQLLPLGGPMLPKAGSVLVKIQSDARVFALAASTEDEGDTLRWIPDEETAITLCGNDWADYVIDLPPTLFPRFREGTEMSENETIDQDLLHKREALQ